LLLFFDYPWLCYRCYWVFNNISLSRNFLLEKFFSKFKNKERETEKNSFIDGDFEDIEDDDDKKL
jgi:hypothetical protein